MTPDAPAGSAPRRRATPRPVRTSTTTTHDAHRKRLCFLAVADLVCYLTSPPEAALLPRLRRPGLLHHLATRTLQIYYADAAADRIPLALRRSMVKTRRGVVAGKPNTYTL